MKNGLPSEPSEMPIDFSSFAEAAPQPSARAATADNRVVLIDRASDACCLESRVAAAGAPLRTRGPLEPVAVERHRADDDEALDNELPDVRDTRQDQPVRQDGNDQRPDQRAPDRADAADEAGAPEDHGGDGVELVGLAELQPVRRVEPRRGHDAA